MSQHPNKHHDTGYKELFSHPEFVQQLMEGFVPAEINSLLDYSTLQLHSGNYITPLFEEKIEDVVWSVHMKPEREGKSVTVYLYILLEFQSKVDRTMPLRMLHYVASFYHQLLKQKNIKLGKDKLPPVLPMVLYNGASAWTAAQSMQSLIQSVPKFLQKYQPQLHYYLVDECRYSDETLQQQHTPLSSVFLTEKVLDPQALQQAVIQLVQSIRNHPDQTRIEQVLLRWMHRHLHQRKIRINLEQVNQLQELPSMFARDFDSWTREWERQGIEKGRIEGKIETARNLLKLGVLSDKQVAEAADLSLEQVQALKKELQP